MSTIETHQPLEKTYSHHYKLKYSLGKFSFLTAEMLADELKTGKIFPLKVIEGNLTKINNLAYIGIPFLYKLEWLPFAKNKVMVINETPNSTHLRALSPHIFQGEVIHKIKQKNNKLFYILKGKGPVDENLFSYVTNNLYIRLGLWKFFIYLNVFKTAHRFDQKLSKISKTPFFEVSLFLCTPPKSCSSLWNQVLKVSFLIMIIKLNHLKKK